MGSRASSRPRQPRSNSRSSASKHASAFIDIISSVSGELNFKNEDLCVVGSLKAHISFWETLQLSPWILGVIQRGYSLPFRVGVEIPNFCMNNNKIAYQYSDFVSGEIEKLLASGAIKEVTCRPQLVNPLSVAVNGQKLRLILDLSRLNKYLDKTTISYDSFDELRPSLCKGGYMGKFDMKSGYHHVDIFEEHQTFLGFCWEIKGIKKYFVYKVCPFGLGPAPMLFTKLFRPLVRRWRERGIHCVLYLDDGIFVARTSEICQCISVFIQRDLHEAGVVTSPAKCVWQPTQQIEWLGLCIDLDTFVFSVSKKRVQKVQRLCQSLLSQRRPSVRERSRLVGSLISTSAVCGSIVQLRTRRLLCTVGQWQPRYNLKILLTDQETLEIRFWQQKFQSLNLRSLQSGGTPMCCLATDASATGAGAVLTLPSGEKHTATQTFSNMECLQSSTFRETITVLFALKSFKTLLFGQRISLFTDNTGVFSIISKGSPKENLQEIAEQIFFFCFENQCEIVVSWVPRDRNSEADEASRLTDFDDWGVKRTIFDLCVKKWGQITIDRFADNLNCLVPRFNSKYFVPNTEKVNAFSELWSGEFNWLCPPISLIAQTIQHLQLSRGVGILAVPFWPSHSFFPFLLSDSGSFLPCVKDHIVYPQGSHIFRPASQYTSVFNQERAPSDFGLFLIDCRI